MDLYWLDTSGDSAWETLDNWNTAADGSGDAPTAVPWVDGAYADSNLYYPTNEGSTDNNSTISGNATCYVPIHNYGTINGGSFTTDVNNNSVINGGTFSVILHSPNSNGVINYAVVTFDIENYVSGTIYDGIYSGYVNNGYSGYSDGGYIAGGTYSIDGFNNYNGTIDFPNISVTSGGDPYTGNWLGQVWDNGSWAGGLPIGDLYYTGAGGNPLWETLTNWNTAADGSGLTPTEIPWTNTDGSTNASNLYDASGGAGILINSIIDQSLAVNGTCDISSVINRGTIYGGTFSGDSSVNDSGTINNGTFSGNYFYNYSTINGGTFSGSGFFNPETIYGGTFSGDGFENGGQIYGGTFSNNGFLNYNGSFCGTFTGTNFDNSYGYVFNADIRGSFNNVPNGFDPNDYATGPTFAPLGQVFDTYFSGPSTGTTAGPLGPYYVYCDSIGAIKYPTPTGGGGGGIDISRLLGLPFFIKI